MLCVFVVFELVLQKSTLYGMRYWALGEIDHLGLGLLGHSNVQGGSSASWYPCSERLARGLRLWHSGIWHMHDWCVLQAGHDF